MAREPGNYTHLWLVDTKQHSSLIGWHNTILISDWLTLGESMVSSTWMSWRRETESGWWGRAMVIFTTSSMVLTRVLLPAGEKYFWFYLILFIFVSQVTSPDLGSCGSVWNDSEGDQSQFIIIDYLTNHRWRWWTEMRETSRTWSLGELWRWDLTMSWTLFTTRTNSCSMLLVVHTLLSSIQVSPSHQSRLSTNQITAL